VRILGISGSLRAASYNTGLLRAARDLAPAGMEVEIARIGDLPLFNEDLELQGWPEPVMALRRQAYAADGILFTCPEYNYNVSGALKNAFDWMSRPEGAGGHTAPEDHEPVPRNPFQDKPCALLGASVGLGGTIRAQLALRQSLQGNGALAMPQPEVFVTFARDKFDGMGSLTDDATRAFLGRFMAAFGAWVARVIPAEERERPPPARESGGPLRSEAPADALSLNERQEVGVEETFPASDPPSLSDPSRRV
jgi:chromate reductase